MAPKHFKLSPKLSVFEKILVGFHISHIVGFLHFCQRRNLMLSKVSNKKKLTIQDIFINHHQTNVKFISFVSKRYACFFWVFFFYSIKLKKNLVVLGIFHGEKENNIFFSFLGFHTLKLWILAKTPQAALSLTMNKWKKILSVTNHQK